MSVVSSIVLFCSGEDAIVYRLDNALRDVYDDPDVAGFERFPTATCGGNKFLQCCVYAAAFNNLDEEAFASRVMAFTWQYPENVVLVIQPEDGATKVYRPPGY